MRSVMPCLIHNAPLALPVINILLTMQEQAVV
jgi:hypothetical protein